MIDPGAPIVKPGGLPQWYLDAKKGRPVVSSPGRRGVNADTYAFPLRLAMEIPLQGNREYRRLRYALDSAERRLATLEQSGAPRTRLDAVRARIREATGAIVQFLASVASQGAETAPTILTRELNADGELLSETTEPVPAQ